MLQESVYAVPGQIMLKQWASASEADRSRRLLLRNPSSSDSAMLLIVPPRTDRFRFDLVPAAAAAAAATPQTTAVSANDTSETPDDRATVVAGGEPHGGICALLPPEGTLACIVSFIPPGSALPHPSSPSNFQDALLVYTGACSLGPALSVPLLALATASPAGGTAVAAANQFHPPALSVPPNPPDSFWNGWAASRMREQEEIEARERLQAQVYPGRGGNGGYDDHNGGGGADVFVVEQHSDDEMGDGDDQDEMMGDGETETEQQRQQQQQAASLSELGQRISAAAALAHAEENEADAGGDERERDRSGPQSSGGVRSLSSRAGLVREGFTARLHSSQGARSSVTSGGMRSARGAMHHPNAQLPGVQQVYQPFARPATAEQRHLAECVDVGFVVSTEAAIDELMEADLAEAEMEEERALLRSSQGARTSIAHSMTADGTATPTTLINPAAMVLGGGAMATSGADALADAQCSAEQDEADFYKQLLATERQREKEKVQGPVTSGAPATPTRSSRSDSRSGGTSSASRSRNGMPRSSPSASPVQVHASSAAPSIPSSSSSRGAPLPPSSASVSISSSRGRGAPSPRRSPEPSSSPPPSQSPMRSSPSPGPSHSPSSSVASAHSHARVLSASMQRLHLHSSGGRDATATTATADSWNDKLARVQDTERRRYVEELQQQQQSLYSASPSLPRQSSLDHSERAPSTASTGLKLPRIA